MLSRETFHAIVEAHLKGLSGVQASRAADLPDWAVSEVRKGRVPSIERAAGLLDALGLELHVRRKGEVIDPRALRLAIDELRNPMMGARLDKETPAIATRMLAEAYARYAQSFDPLFTSDPDKVFRILQASAEDMETQLFGQAGGGDETSQS